MTRGLAVLAMLKKKPTMGYFARQPFLFTVIVSLVSFSIGCFFASFGFWIRDSPANLKTSLDQEYFHDRKVIEAVKIGGDLTDGSSRSKLPAFAYYISGTIGDVPAMTRLLMAIYHPRNEYLLHLELKAAYRERLALTKFIEGVPLFAEVGNVHIMSESNLVTYRGVTMLANYLHGAAVLLKQRRDWDWYINLSAADYPLMPQDDFLHVFSNVSRDLNFISHYSNLGIKLDRRAKPIILDPAIWDKKATAVEGSTKKRKAPNTFKLFTGSAWVVLSRAFTEFCVCGWDNLPRLLLLYYTNYASAPEGYFHTVLCNSPFQDTAVNHDLHYLQFMNGAQHPLDLDQEHFEKMAVRGAPFARKFLINTPVLDDIDRQLLNRTANHIVPGGWCRGPRENGEDPCLAVGDPLAVQPGEGAQKLQKLMDKLLEPQHLKHFQCSEQRPYGY